MTSTAAPFEALRALDGVSVADADTVACLRILGGVRQVRGFLGSLEGQVSTRLDELAATGDSFGSEAASVRCSGVSSREARKRKRRSETLAEAPSFDEALAAGTVTAEHVDQLANTCTKLSEELRAGLLGRVDSLLAHAQAHDPAGFGRHVRDVARNLERDSGITRDQQQHEATSLTWKVLADGMYDVHARLHPLLGNRLIRMIDAEVAARVAAGEAAGDPEFTSRSVNRSRLAAEALVGLATGGHQQVRPVVAEISVLIDADSLATGEAHEHTIAETSHGAPLPISSVRALLCAGIITPVVVGANGTVPDLGRARRTPNRSQRRALRTMYRTCAADGCEVLFERCEVHHIVPWEHHGATDLHNLVPVCARHHHEIHRHHWQLHLAPDRTLTVTDQHGRTVMITTPDMPHPARDPRRRSAEPARAGDPPRHRRPLPSS